MSVFIGYPSFMAYQMMKGKKGNNDNFPSIPGITARYSRNSLSKTLPFIQKSSPKRIVSKPTTTSKP